MVQFYSQALLAALSVGVGGVPLRSKYVERFREDVVVDETGVDGESSHQNNDVATLEYGGEHLQTERRRGRGVRGVQ